MVLQYINNYIYTAPQELISGNDIFEYIQNDAKLYGRGSWTAFSSASIRLAAL
jgi:hypothetical protein